MTAQIPANEAVRLKTLRSLRVLDTAPEPYFDDIVEVAKTLLGVPIAVISLIDEDRQWFKAKSGVDLCETGRDVAFCAHSIHHKEPTVVPDATLDERFADNPLVTGDFHLRFYAGAPIIVDGLAMGTLCCLDVKPFTPTDDQIKALAALARQAEALFEARLETNHFEAERTQFLSFFDHSPAVVYVKDESGRMRFVNRCFEETTGLSQDAILGRRNYEWMPEAMATVLQKQEDAVRSSGKMIETDTIIAHPDGSDRTWHCLKFPIQKGSKTWVGCFAIDVTETRLAQRRVVEQTLEVEQANEELAKAVDLAESWSDAAHQAARRFAQLFDGLPVACFTYDANAVIQEWNDAAEELWGISSSETFLQPLFGTVVGEENRAAKEEVIRRVFAGEAVRDQERCDQLRNGQSKWILTSTFPMRDSQGRIVGAFSANVDVTERKAVESKVRENEKLLRTVIGSLHEGLVVQDSDGKIVLWNQSAESILGLTADELDGRTSLDPRWRSVTEDGSDLPGAEHPAMKAISTGQTQQPTIIGIHRPTGELRWLSVGAAPIIPEEGGVPISSVASFFDMTDRLEQERRITEQMKQIREYSSLLAVQKAELEQANVRLQALATTDGLTGLKNHRAFQEELRFQMELISDSDRRVGIILLDVDHFKQYNDEFGHPEGDAVLRGVAEILQRDTPPNSFVARYGGEEFVVLVPDCQPELVKKTAERLRRTLMSRQFSGRKVTASFGVAVTDHELVHATSLVKAADEALYASKMSGRNRVTVWSGHQDLATSKA